MTQVQLDGIIRGLAERAAQQRRIKLNYPAEPYTQRRGEWALEWEQQGDEDFLVTITYYFGPHVSVAENSTLLLTFPLSSQKEEELINLIISMVDKVSERAEA